MISVLFHEEVGHKNQFFEEFAWDLLNGNGKYNGSKGLSLEQMFNDKKAATDEKKCPDDSNNAGFGTVVKFDYWL